MVFFNVRNKNNKFHFTVSISDDDFNVISIPSGAYEFESLNDEFRRITLKEGYFTEADYPFQFKPSFSALGSIMEISSQG